MTFSAVGFPLPVTDSLAGVTPDFGQSLARHYVAGVDAISLSWTGTYLLMSTLAMAGKVAIPIASLFPLCAREDSENLDFSN